MQLAANLSTQFADGPWPDRVRRAAAAGFGRVEMQWPYDDCPAADLRRALDGEGLVPVLINAPVGMGEAALGHASLPGAEDAFRRSIVEALTYAQTVGCPLVHVVAGTGRGDTARAAFVENLAWAAEQAEATATGLVIEAINRADKPDYHLAGVDDTVRVIDAVASSSLGLMFDFYHAHRNGEDAASLIHQHAAAIRHVQISDHPGRGEPGSGEIDFAPGLAALRETGYAGAVGCEFRPTGTPEDCLGWAGALGFDLDRD